MKKLTLVLSGLMLLLGCQEDFFDTANPNQISVQTFYKTEADAIAAANSVYATLQRHDMYQRAWFLVLDGMSDDVAYTTDNDLDDVDVQMAAYTHGPENSRSNDFWRTLYLGAFRSNQVITNVGKMIETFPDLNEDVLNRVIGEARFLRGWFYFQLVKYYGGVPIVEDEPTVGEYNVPKSTAQQVYDFIEEDLTFAEANLLGKDDSDPGRATTGAASALLGKVYLFQKEYAGAVTQFLKVDGLGYSLTTTFTDNFTSANENNEESVFEVQFTEDGSALWSNDESTSAEHTFRHVMYWRWWKWTASSNLQWNDEDTGFEDGDPRGGLSFHPSGRSLKYTYAAADDVLANFRKSDINFRVIRYADVLLMHAEALIESNTDLPGATTMINTVRQRARDNAAEPLEATEFPLIGAGKSQGELRDIVRRERRVELAFEQSRYADLIRWGMAASVITDDDREFVEGKHELWPIPASEIVSNEGVSASDQNPGY